MVAAFKLLLFVLLLFEARPDGGGGDALEILFKSLTCVSQDKKFLTIEKCELLSVAPRKENASTEAKELYVHAKLLRKPVYDLAVVVQFFQQSKVPRRKNHEISLDACAFMKSRRNPFIAFVYMFMEPYTNFNHTCPIHHDIILRGLRSDFTTYAYAPMPPGDYTIIANWSTKGIKHAQFKFDFQLDNAKNMD